VAERAAHTAGELLLGRFGGPARGVGPKSSPTDLVSDADRAAEAAISELLRDERPGDGLLSEEGAERASSSGRRWVVDPLDGTTNFLYGYPAWSVSVALEDDGGTAVAVVHDPARGETFRALRGQGCELNGTRVQVRAHDRLETALIATGFAYEPGLRAVQADTLCRLLPKVRDVRRAGSAALDLAWLAAGRLDGYYERGLNPWDWAAGRLLVTEAGGALGELRGEPPGLVAASGELLDRLAGALA
jgi:myo-inositol-1(or 4)-monophosphatase